MSALTVSQFYYKEMNTSLQFINRTKIKEDLIVGSVFLSLLLPLRLLFYTYLSHYWIGSFGILITLSLSIFYLSKKGKLGFFGKMYINVFNRRTKGKTFKVVLAFSIFTIYISSLIIVSNTLADTTVYDKTKVDLKNQGITNMTSLQTYNNSHPSTMGLVDHLKATLLLITPNPFSFVVFKVANDLLGGWLLTVFTLCLVSEVEFLTVLFYMKWSTSKLV